MANGSRTARSTKSTYTATTAGSTASPAYATRVVQDEKTKDFTAQFWNPAPFDWQGDRFDDGPHRRIIHLRSPRRYGAAAGRCGQLPRIRRKDSSADQGRRLLYGTVDGIAEHPYYGSFGYHVSNFFAPSSRFGTPEELKKLVRTAHQLGLAVIMDLVHAHYVKNLNEGIDELDGTDHLYSLPGEAGNQPYWDSKTFDYGKEQVRHFCYRTSNTGSTNSTSTAIGSTE